MGWHRLVTWATGVAGTGLVAYGVIAAFSTYQGVYAPEAETIVHQLFLLAETCMWLLVAMLGVGFLIVARARQFREERIEARTAATPASADTPMVPRSAPRAQAKKRARAGIGRGWFDSAR